MPSRLPHLVHLSRVCIILEPSCGHLISDCGLMWPSLIWSTFELTTRSPAQQFGKLYSFCSKQNLNLISVQKWRKGAIWSGSVFEDTGRLEEIQGKISFVDKYTQTILHLLGFWIILTYNTLNSLPSHAFTFKIGKWWLTLQFGIGSDMFHLSEEARLLSGNSWSFHHLSGYSYIIAFWIHRRSYTYTTTFKLQRVTF